MSLSGGGGSAVRGLRRILSTILSKVKLKLSYKVETQQASLLYKKQSGTYLATHERVKPRSLLCYSSTPSLDGARRCMHASRFRTRARSNSSQARATWGAAIGSCCWHAHPRWLGLERTDGARSGRGVRWLTHPARLRALALPWRPDLAISSRSGSRSDGAAARTASKWRLGEVHVSLSLGENTYTSSRPCTGIKSNIACTYAPMLVCPRVENIIALYVVSDQTIYLAHSFT
jgi:hypothetical protein